MGGGVGVGGVAGVNMEAKGADEEERTNGCIGGMEKACCVEMI